MSDTIKFTDQEMQSIVKLQNDYQQNIFALGQLDLEKTDLEHQLSQIKEQRDKIYDNWKNLQNLESQLLNSLSEKYGDGSLNIKDGTFKPTVTR
jgi:hypothetical protein